MTNRNHHKTPRKLDQTFRKYERQKAVQNHL